MKPSLPTAHLRGHPLSWNQKNLDYEIETCKMSQSSLSLWTLEIKRTSITRLKLTQLNPLVQILCSTWNQKNLDYEIETFLEMKRRCNPILNLKSKEPRLRDWNAAATHAGRFVITLKSKEPRLRDWNGKDGWNCGRSRIGGLKSKEPRLRDWNIRNPLSIMLTKKNLKSKEPRLRDWNGYITKVSPAMVCLKSKEPRLRDWNLNTMASMGWMPKLEIKRTSITRLKPVYATH